MTYREARNEITKLQGWCKLVDALGRHVSEKSRNTMLNNITFEIRRLEELIHNQELETDLGDGRTT